MKLFALLAATIFVALSAILATTWVVSVVFQILGAAAAVGIGMVMMSILLAGFIMIFWGISEP